MKGNFLDNMKMIFAYYKLLLTRWEICCLLGFYAASSGNSLPAFRDNLLVPSSRIKNPKRNPVTLVRGLWWALISSE